jgi:hypothetical protein
MPVSFPDVEELTYIGPSREDVLPWDVHVVVDKIPCRFSWFSALGCQRRLLVGISQVSSLLSSTTYLLEPTTTRLISSDKEEVLFLLSTGRYGH